ncbi:hypothetical protein DSO57_1023719 [Entomophthora muscae]|uniref:Uncharacterized protein n=1 Tax=Entomophthora muscae TaxID=34485 RepID=A0ACC2UCQ9_9FUNG|nr:hypothetical protein DSO57_1023719 [Entomophthora muscae]
MNLIKMPFQLGVDNQGESSQEEEQLEKFGGDLEKKGDNKTQQKFQISNVETGESGNNVSRSLKGIVNNKANNNNLNANFKRKTRACPLGQGMTRTPAYVFAALQFHIADLQLLLGFAALLSPGFLQLLLFLDVSLPADLHKTEKNKPI